jgi:tetratricopeptide (TPR) repeat protein
MLPTARRTASAPFLLLVLPAAAVCQWPPDSLTNLQVLPEATPVNELVGVMAGFTRALGVRCSHCHVGEEGRPLATYDFASDEKALKQKARVMLRMVRRLNDELTAELPERAAPPIEVQCFTCHRGVQEPRTLQAILIAAYDTGGIDSTLAAYRALRERYYGRAAYDFGEVALADVADDLDRRGHLADAVALGALNVAVNPASGFAKRGHASAAIALAYRDAVDEGAARYHRILALYGDRVVTEGLLNQLGYRLLREGRAGAAVDVFELNVGRHPDSWNAYDSLGEGYVAAGDTTRAVASYQKSLELNPGNANGAERLRVLSDRR